MYQKITIVGNVGNEPEMGYLPSGTAKTTLKVATNRVYRDSQGQQVKETTWFRVTCLGKLGELHQPFSRSSWRGLCFSRT